MRTWTTPDGLAFEDEQTGDGRLFVPGSLSWEDQPNGWPLRYDPEDDGGHNGAVLVGAIGSLDRNGNAIVSTGTLDDESETGAEVARQLDNDAPLGVSVDMDDMEIEWVLADPEEVEDEGPVVLLAAALPTAQVMFRQDGVVGVRADGLRGLLASAGLVAAAGEGDPEDGIVLWSDSMDAVICRVTRARIRGATLVDIPAYSRAWIQLDPAAAGPAETTPDADGADEARTTAAADEPCLPCLAEEQAVVAAAAPMRPPRAWFDNPGFGELTPLTVTDDGRVFGHIAGWGQCHTGGAGQCILTPRSASGYAYFHTGVVRTAEGQDLPVGPLTLGGGHANDRLSFSGAIEHYDNVASRVADVRGGEDAYGVWVAGAMRPDVMADELRMRQFRAAPPSGDWRWINGGLELILAHSVNTGGFPVPRARVASSGRVTALVAAGAREVAIRARQRGGRPMTALSADVIAKAVQDGIAGYVAAQAQADRDAAAARLRRMDPARQAAIARLRTPA